MYATVCLFHARMCFIPLHVLTISTRGHNSHELIVDGLNIRLCLCLCHSGTDSPRQGGAGDSPGASAGRLVIRLERQSDGGGGGGW